jgi:mRNA-degrading endonuclease RelE of RelBE toxin-antitoxin system
MKSRTTRRFRKAYQQLPEEIRRRADKSYELFEQNPNHPSLRFKKVHPSEPIYSVRVSRDFRVLGVLESETMIWFWIGSHRDYEKLIS